MAQAMRKIRASLLIFVTTVSVAVAAPKLTFKDSYVRYLSGHDLFRLLVQKFPGAKWEAIPDCGQLSDKNRASLGDANPATGEMTYRTTSASFVKWYAKCVLLGIDRDFESAGGSAHGMDRFFG